MRAMKISTFAATSLFILLGMGGTAIAQEFVCKEITLTRTMAGVSGPANTLLSEKTALHLIIDKDNPGRSSIRWSGAPKMDGATTTLPSDAKIIVENGIIATSFVATRDGISSVGTATLDSEGGLRVTESTLTQPGILIFDVLEAKCHEGRD